MKKYGFLFGAGAEIAYNLPSGGQFALDIFRKDTTQPKNQFKEMIEKVDATTTYASEWLPKDYRTKNISTYGKSVFHNIIMSTVEHRRGEIISKVNDFDSVATSIANTMSVAGTDVNAAFADLLKKNVGNIHLDQVIAYNDAFKNGNKLFKSSYFSGLLMVYRDYRHESFRPVLGKILLSIMQLQLGALSEDLTRNINDNLFAKKDDEIDLFDDFGDLIQLNYSAAGAAGLEYLLEAQEIDTSTSYGIIVRFAQLLIENIYASVLDYKSLIDTNWHYLYNPSSDWAKFCKISIFLLTVYNYITVQGSMADRNNPNGYYYMLRDALNSGIFEVSTIATTNYNKLIEDVLGRDDITYLNGSVTVWYDPYLNKTGTISMLNDDEHHIIVPLLFTQSGTKPMTSISMSVKYVEMYKQWKESDAIVVVGFGFSPDDEHINGILRTLVNDDGKELVVVTLCARNDLDIETKEIVKKLKISDARKVRLIPVDQAGYMDGKRWIEFL